MMKQTYLLIGALALLDVISEAEDADAQFKLGMKYWSLRNLVVEGEGVWGGVPENNLAALKCFRKAAEQGHASGQFSLGFMLYHFHNGIQTNPSEAAKWFRKAAAQGHARACSKIGWMYRYGEPVPEDKDKAAKWLLKAAKQGHAKSQVWLAQILDAEEVFLNEIEGIVDDEVEAAKWWQKAAEQGNGLAQMEIGNKYYYGIGVPQNDVEAYVWLLLAKDRGYGDGVLGVSSIIEELEERMTPNQRAQGQARSLELHKTIRKQLDELQKQGIGKEEPY